MATSGTEPWPRNPLLKPQIQSCPAQDNLSPQGLWQRRKTCVCCTGWGLEMFSILACGTVPHKQGLRFKCQQPAVEKLPRSSENPFPSVEFTYSYLCDSQFGGSLVVRALPCSKTEPVSSESPEGSRPQPGVICQASLPPVTQF